MKTRGTQQTRSSSQDCSVTDDRARRHLPSCISSRSRLRFLIASEKGESKSSSGANTDGSVVDAVVAIGDNEELVWGNLRAARGEDKVVVCVVVVVVTVTVGQEVTGGHNENKWTMAKFSPYPKA